LTQIYGNTNRRDRLEQIDNRYSRQMFDAKMMAIGRHDKRKEYDFHLALGTMYSYLEKWQDPRWSPGSAIYQLENARRVADEYNKEHPASEHLQLPTQSVRQLSDAYVKTGQFDKAVQLRVDVAEKALNAGDKEGAKEVMGGKWDAAIPNTVDPGLKKRLLDVSKRVDRKP